MRFLLDENVGTHTLADFLRGLGHDVVTVSEFGRKGMDDDAVLDLARKEDRIIVTANRIHFDSPDRYRECGGVITISGRLSIRQVKIQLERCLKRHNPEFFARNRVSITTDGCTGLNRARPKK